MAVAICLCSNLCWPQLAYVFETFPQAYLQHVTWQEMVVMMRQAGSKQAGKAAPGLGGGEAGAQAPPSALTMQHQPGASQPHHTQARLLRYRLWPAYWYLAVMGLATAIRTVSLLCVAEARLLDASCIALAKLGCASV